MKKLFALLLVLAMLLPMGLLPVANAEDFTAEPFYALSWSDMDNDAYPYLDGLVTSNFGTSGDKATISYGGAKITYNKDGLDDANVTKFAEALKKTMDSRPAGMRYWHLWAPSKVLKLKPENIIYLDYGVDMMKVLVTAIMKKYKEIGGLLDGIVIDTEYVGLSAYYIYSDTDKNANNATKDPLIYKKIVDDPRYLTEVRPLLEERGFVFYENITDYTPEIYSIAKGAGSKYSACAGIWGTVMRNRLTGYLNEWAYEPLKTYFPEASMSDYQTTDSAPWLKVSAATDDGESTSSGRTFKAGTASCFSFYSARPDSDFFEAMNKYTGYNDALFEATAFNTFLYDINFARQMYLANDMEQIAPWITSYTYNSKKEGTLAYTPYYTEEIYHLGLMDPEPFLSYTYIKSYSAENWEMVCEIMNAIMAELTRVAGYSDRKPIEVPAYWNSEFIISGMYANGRNIWRITPINNRVTREEFLVEGTDPTFRVEGQTVTFPGGKIIEDSTIPTAGTYGYWVETPADVTPIVTRDDNYFAKYPSLSCDFEDTTEGTFDNNNHKPLTTWEFTWKKGATTTIEKIGDNKVLALNGNVEVRSAKLPGNITAGDSYAEDQAWQITVTIPEGLDAEAEISLLYYVGAKQKIKDGGFKIVGGKLYYGTIGTDPEDETKTVQEYKELMDIAPGTYIFRREVNFNNSEDFRSTFAVYDTTGKELKSKKNVATPVFTTITTIGFSTTGTGDKPVYLDNYSINLTGTATDFELYDAAYGAPVKDLETPRDVATAYRLSWLNATAKDETATVMAAFYNGETLVEEKVIKEVKMASGYDGVETGIVEVAEGQTVKVYLKTTIKAPGADDNAGQGLNPALIAVIAAVAVAVIGLAVVLLVTKKRAPKPTEE